MRVTNRIALVSKLLSRAGRRLAVLVRPKLVATVLIAGVAGAERPAEPPNLVVIIADDLGYADVGFNGCEDIPTPSIDRIAAEGVRFTSGYVTAAVCGPSRAGLITGRYQHRFGSSLNPTVDPSVPNGVPRDERTIAEMLKPAGYDTMAVGKWHLGTFPGLRPRERGFDEFYGFLSGGHNYFPENLTLEDLSEVRQKWGWYRTKLLHNGERVGTDDYLTDELSDAAVEFIGRDRESPFFVYLAYNAPHTPLQATEEYLSRFPGLEGDRRTYAAMVSAMDDGIGRVLDALDRRDVADNTLVVFLSDNGGAKNNASSNGALRGWKGDLFEGGVRVPFAMRWPAELPAGVDYDEAMTSMDIAATIVVAAGPEAAAALDPSKPLDGVDIRPYVRGEVASLPYESIYWWKPTRGDYALRRGNMKLVDLGKDGGEGVFAFAISHDRGETRSIAEHSASVVAEMVRSVREWASGMVPPAYPGLGSWKPGEGR
ncbi:MAG: sulfatase-like hydrolase/transferase [Planctomycetota bacterium]